MPLAKPAVYRGFHPLHPRGLDYLGLRIEFPTPGQVVQRPRPTDPDPGIPIGTCRGPIVALSVVHHAVRQPTARSAHAPRVSPTASTAGMAARRRIRERRHRE